MANKNMGLWEKVQKSDPKALKKVTFGREFTAINANHQIKAATEQFGPFGKGFGVSNESFEMLFPGLLKYQATFWWVEKEDQPEVYEFAISSSISTHNNKGRMDDECVKKVATDALTKGLSRLGFNADVFLGLWDDNKYAAQMRTEAEQKEAESKVEQLTQLAQTQSDVALTLAEKGDIEGISKIWTSNPQLHNIKGFKEGIAKAGNLAKQHKQEEKADGEAKAETSS